MYVFTHRHSHPSTFVNRGRPRIMFARCCLWLLLGGRFWIAYYFPLHSFQNCSHSWCVILICSGETSKFINNWRFTKCLFSAHLHHRWLFCFSSLTTSCCKGSIGDLKECGVCAERFLLTSCSWHTFRQAYHLFIPSFERLFVSMQFN